MRDATRIFQEAYSGEQRRRSQFGMDHNGEFDPANNPFATGRDPESVEWDDEGGDDDLDDGDAEAELEAALRQARADEMEDEEESEDEDESFAKAGVRDSRRGARQSEDEDEADDPIVDEDGIGFDDHRFPDSRRGALLKNDSRQLSCGECGGTASVRAPKGFRFARAGETEGTRPVKWTCARCGSKSNRGKVTAIRRASATEAIGAFRRKYQAEPRPLDPALSPVQAFRESYSANSDILHWRECTQRHGG